MVYSEPDLIIPALRVFKESPGIDTSQLIARLRKELRPSGHDLKILAGRRDDVFSQKVRNLKSHNTFARKGLAEYRQGKWWITPQGEKYLEENDPLFVSLENQGFRREVIRKEVIRDFSEIIIEEGALEKRTTTQRTRSEKLRDVAVDEFKKKHNMLFCEACGFNFHEKYGELGKDYIEAHHTEPIHSSEIEGVKTTLEKALKKVVLLCANCHRMIHRRRGEMLSIEVLKQYIKP